MVEVTYAVVTLRKCARGGPLLPVVHPATGVVEGWEPVGKGGGAFTLPLAEYLQEFICRIGARPMAIHSTLNGWHLPPYQAVVRRDQWKQLWGLLEAPFRDMRTAYRYHIGGSAAPGLSTTVEPRFMAVAEPDDNA